MPFPDGSTYTRSKTFVNAGSLLPADLNNIQDDLGEQIVFLLSLLEPSLGTVHWQAVSFVPTYWLLADGSPVTLASGHLELRSALLADGSKFGTSGADPRLPSLLGRSPIGTGTGAGLTGRVLGDVLGEESHLLTVPEMPSHTHATVNGQGIATNNGTQLDAQDLAGPAGTIEGVTSLVNTGGSTPHNNIHPSLALVPIVYCGPN